MVVSNYDINVQLTLATTAEHEGDVFTALDFLGEAQRLARGTDRITRARVFMQGALLRLRLLQLRAQPTFA
jgi:hypothetical protein